MAHPVVSCLCQLMNFLGFGTVCCPSAPHVCSYSLASMLPGWDWLLLSGLCWLSAGCPGDQWRPSCMFLAQDAGLHNTLVFSRFWTFGVSVLMWFSSPTLCDENHMSHHPQQSHLCWGCGCPHKIKDHTACHCYCLLLLECFVSGFLCGAFCSL